MHGGAGVRILLVIRLVGMHRIDRRSFPRRTIAGVASPLLPLLAMTLASCSSPEPDTITLTAEGPAGPASITYQTPDGERTEEVTLPWTMSFETSGDFFAEVTVRNPGTSGEVSCRITGARLPAAADGEAQARCAASRSGDSGEVSASGDPFVQVNGEPVSVPSLRLERPTPYSPRGFALQGELAWFADGGVLTGIGLDGSERTSTAASGANGVTAAPDGTVWAVNNNVFDEPESLVAIAADFTEQTFEVTDGLLAGPIAAVGDEVWAIAHGSQGGEVIRYSSADGTELGRLPGGDEASFVTAGAFGAVIEVGDEMVLYDVGGTELLRSSQLVIGDGPDGVTLAIDPDVGVVFEVAMPELESGRIGSSLLDRLPERLVTVGDVTAAVGDDTVWLIDPVTLDPTCEFFAGMPVLGVSDTEVWVNVPDIREVAVYRLADLPC